MQYKLHKITIVIVNIMLAFAGVMLGLRFILKVFAANGNNDFVNWIYEVSGEILGPFRGIFSSANIEGFVIEFTTLFALVVYLLIGMVLFYVIDLLAPNSKSEK